MGICPQGTPSPLHCQQQGMLASDLLFLGSRLHRQSGGRLVCLLPAQSGGRSVRLLPAPSSVSSSILSSSPKEPLSDTLLLVDGFSVFLSGSLSVNSILPCSAGFQSRM